jgi:ketosteroid isomerase-like protein
MSQQTAIVFNSHEAWGESDMDRMVEGWAEDIVWDMEPYQPAWRGPAEFVGVPAILGFLGEWLGEWRTQDLQLLESEESGEYVLVILNRYGMVRKTGTTVDRRWAQLWTFRDGLAVRIRNHSDPDRARAEFAAATGRTSGR